MNIDFNTPLSDIFGNPLEGGKLTLRVASINALMAPVREAETAKAMPSTELLRHYALALRISEATAPLDVAPEDAALIRERIATTYPTPAVVGPAWMALGS